MDYIRFKLSKEEQALEYELRLKFYEFGRRFINDCCCNDEVSHLFRNNTSDREIIYSIKVQPYKSVGYDLEHEGDFIVTLDGIVYEFRNEYSEWGWKIVTDKYLVSAVTQINNINATLDNMASDSVITREEELVLQKIWAAEVADHNSLLKKATEYEIDYDSYDDKYDTLEGLMNAVFTTLETQETASINEEAWNTAWLQYWTQKVLLEEALSKFVTAGLSVRPTYDPETGMLQDKAKLYGDKVVLSAAHKMEFDAETISINSNEFVLNENGAMFSGDVKIGGTKQADGDILNPKILLAHSGDGHIAGGNISWNENGDVTFKLAGINFEFNDAKESQLALKWLLEAFEFVTQQKKDSGGNIIYDTEGNPIIELVAVNCKYDFWSSGSIAAFGKAQSSGSGSTSTMFPITKVFIDNLN